MNTVQTTKNKMANILNLRLIDIDKEQEQLAQQIIAIDKEIVNANQQLSDVYVSSVRETMVEAKPIKRKARKQAKKAKKASIIQTTYKGKPTASSTLAKMLQDNKGKEFSVDEIDEGLNKAGTPIKRLHTFLSKMCTKGIAKRISKGIYASA